MAAPELKAWRLDFERLMPDRSSQKDPPGYDAAIATNPVTAIVPGKKKDSSTMARRQQMLYAKAQAPLKQVGMMCFMAWMFGNSIQIFSIFMTFQLVSAPFSAILSSADVFPKDEDFKQLDTLTPRLLYCLVHSAQLLFGLYKLNAMGLLPAHPADWISTMAVPPAIEHAFAPLAAS